MKDPIDLYSGGGKPSLLTGLKVLRKRKKPPFDTESLRNELTRFLDTKITEGDQAGKKYGDFKWGVYGFFDYDGEPIYVGQTNEKIRVRIRRHLTNQRTDAVAMSVLDPFEVHTIKIWPLPQFEGVPVKSDKGKEAKKHLNALESQVTRELVEASIFKAILNEKDPPPTEFTVDIPDPYSDVIVSEAVHFIRSHPDFRIARRAMIIGRLAQVIAEREVKGGLRRVLVTQATRLEWLSKRRFESTGGQASVEKKDPDAPEDDSPEDDGQEDEDSTEGK